MCSTRQIVTPSTLPPPYPTLPPLPEGVCLLRSLRAAGLDPHQHDRVCQALKERRGCVQHQHLQSALHVQHTALRLAHVATRNWAVPAHRLDHVLPRRGVQASQDNVMEK